MQRLEFLESFDSLNLNKESYKGFSVENRYLIAKNTLMSLDSSTNKGFLPHFELDRFPIISEILPSFTIGELDEVESLEVYKWLYNFVILTLYTFCLESLELNCENVELVEDLRGLIKELYARLDTSIRYHIQKRGVSVKENTYVGFDTEFTKKDNYLNTMVSAQLAVTTKTYVQIPKYNCYKISMIDEKTNKLIKTGKTSPNLNYQKIEISIQNCIREIRKLKFEKSDLEMTIIGECLRAVKGVSFVEMDDYTMFSLPRSVIQPYIHFGESFSIKEILEISSTISTPYITNAFDILMNLFRGISSYNFNFLNGKDKLFEEIHKTYLNYREIEFLGLDSDKPLPCIPHLDITRNKNENENEKAVTRRFLTNFSHRISVTRVKVYFIVAHLTPADLSLLSDFDLIKEDLSVVNGSFVTLGKYFKYEGKNVHIRDTMLLAPGGSRSLASIGLLYQPNFNKVKIEKSDLEDMNSFLTRDKELFTEYALRDAIISLIHAS